MSKPIRITKAQKTQVQAEFSALLDNMKMSDGEISYSKSFNCKDAAAILWMSPVAYAKTVALVNAFDDEVAWHGTASRKSAVEFVVEDIFVYPQEVTGASVVTDQEQYTNWLYGFDDATFTKIRMQCQSHVEMGVSPSDIDVRHRAKILGQLDSDMFYIFMIWNKRMDTHTLIYDMEENIMYGDSDITVKLMGDGSLDGFLADAESKVQQQKAPVYRGRGRNGGAFDGCGLRGGI
jgi:hypothetical protein